MARIDGDEKANILTGTAWGDAIFGGGGNDTINGLAGDDYLHGGTGVDRIFAGTGSDRMNFTTGVTNYSSSNKAFELLDGSTGYDHAHIDLKDSKVEGVTTESVSIVANGAGNFTIYAIADLTDPEMGYARIANTVSVESFALRADGPSLYYSGNIGGPPMNLFLTATDRADEFVGGGESSKVDLMAGDDVLYVSMGADRFTLGEGADTVFFNEAYNGPRDTVITDFKVGVDRLVLDGWTQETLTVTEDRGGTLISGSDDKLYLAGVKGYDDWTDFIA